MDTVAVIFERPERLRLDRVDLIPPADDDVVVDVEWTGISTGTEKLLWAGRMPPFPGMGYPLVPGYETVGRISYAGSASNRQIGERVFVAGAKCFGNVKGLFGGAASRLVVRADRAIAIHDTLADRGVLIALCATAYHAISGGEPPELIVGHGVLGRLLARVTLALGAPEPLVLENNSARVGGGDGYEVIQSLDACARSFGSIYDVSGDHRFLDALISKLAPRGTVVLAGFYSEPVSFAFPPAFMKEARIRVAAEWQQSDLEAVRSLIASGKLSLDNLITHRMPATDAQQAYRTAFEDPNCLKMILDWSAAV